ncbi:hypothetical protein G6O69_26075 [Pseudenhygromyxa sp. WMMC2535]|uniref:hypothetical protein n=1 Tax=Pseudenhygromyxa sp. WMMC2535 TaxID=2712867 RepID=UPI001551A487|nr:hypothetical protein [Pseudenhygromyxa sp. WMMC2535]NVB41332.1 hypothetical protein [Pseudenhygromyxa sp. WMMC2535]
MASPDPLAAARRPSPLRALLVAGLIAGLGVGAWSLLGGGGEGQAEDPARVLLVAPNTELVEFLEHEGFDPLHMTAAELISEGRRGAPERSELDAMARFADRQGIGYLALDLAHGERYDFSSLDPAPEGALEAPPGASFAVLSVGDLGRHLRFAGPLPEVSHDKPAGEQVGLLLALFAQPALAKARTRAASNDLMIRFGSAGTVDHLLAYERAREVMARQLEAWRELAEDESAATDAGPPIELADPFERLLAWPLANGEVLLASAAGAWHSVDGLASRWGREGGNAAHFFVLGPPWDQPQRRPCPDLPETLDIDEGFVIGPAGDALLIPADRWVSELWVLSGEGCQFEARGQIRRLGDGSLGIPRASGHTAAVIDGKLSWADLRMRAYRQLALPGVSLRDHALRWLDDDTVIVPASLDLAEAAAVESASTPGAPAGPAELDEPAKHLDALVWIRLPPARVDDTIELAIVPIDALLSPSPTPSPPLRPPPSPSMAQASDYALVDLFPLVDGASVIAHVDGPEGGRLVQIGWRAEAAEAWTNALDPDYRLAAAIARGREGVELRPRVDALPREASELTLSPTGSHAAWAASFAAPGEDGDPADAYEIVVLPLGPRHEPAAPQRLTHNARSDQAPRFAADGRLLIFDSRYHPDDELPMIESVRALPLR